MKRNQENDITPQSFSKKRKSERKSCFRRGVDLLYFSVDKKEEGASPSNRKPRKMRWRKCSSRGTIRIGTSKGA